MYVVTYTLNKCKMLNWKNIRHRKIVLLQPTYEINAYVLCFDSLESIMKDSLHNVNSSHPNPRWREIINLNFYFHTSLWCLKGKAFIKPFETSQRSVKIKI